MSLVRLKTWAYDKYLSHNIISSGYLSAKFPKSFIKALKAFNLLSSLIPFGVSFKLLEISLLYCSSIVFFASNIILKITSTKEKINFKIA